MSDKTYAHIAIPLPVEGVFDYRVPEAVREMIAPGARVWVPFGRKKRVFGFVVGFSDETQVSAVKDIIRLIDNRPIITPALLTLTRWLADYYFCSWGEAIALCFPGSLKRGSKQIAATALDAWRSKKSPVLTQRYLPLMQAVTQGVSGVWVIRQMSGERFRCYAEIVAHCLKEKKSVLIIMPDSLSVYRLNTVLKDLCPEQLILFHRDLTDKARRLGWHTVRCSAQCVVIGTRSAAFAPVNNCGAIIIDDEHTWLYKAEEVPHYHAREVVLKRGELQQVPVIIGSLTPSLETWYKLDQKVYRSFDTERMMPDAEVDVSIIDLTAEVHKVNQRRFISQVLETMLAQALERKERCVLFTNRRGFATQLLCEKCHTSLMCDNCSVPLVYHRKNKMFQCHYCTYHVAATETCPHCEAPYVSYRGRGTEKLEQQLMKVFPQARIARVDADILADAIARRKLIADCVHQRIDMLIGTAAVEHFIVQLDPALLVLLKPDDLFHFSDFRAAEKAFSLFYRLTQPLYTSPQPKKLIIETHQKMHPVIGALQKHDEQAFYADELTMRRDLGYPPFNHLIKVSWRGKVAEKVYEASYVLSDKLTTDERLPQVSFLGPAPDPIGQKRTTFRYSLIAKTTDPQQFLLVLKEHLGGLGRSQRIILTVDVDPL